MTQTHHDHDHEVADKVTFGFWVYLMTDFIMFAALFATYAVLHPNTYGGPGIAQMASLEQVLWQTLCLLASTFTCGLAFLAAQKNSRATTLFYLALALVLGAGFVGLEFSQFAVLWQQGITWQGSAFLSAYFSLVGLQGIHVVIGLLWILIVMLQLACQNLSPTMKIRMTCLSLFWSFVNIVWIFIFTIVYLMGAI